MEQVKHLSDLSSIIKTAQALLVYFYNDDCPPCISLRPKIENMINSSFKKMKLVWVNSKTYPDIPASFNVFANPVILIFFEGKEFRRFSKYVSVLEIEQSIERYYRLILNVQ